MMRCILAPVGSCQAAPDDEATNFKAPDTQTIPQNIEN